MYSCASQRLRPRMCACCRAAAVILPGPSSRISDQRPATVFAGSLLRRRPALPNRSSLRRRASPAAARLNPVLVLGLFRAVRQQRLQVAALVQAHQDVAAAHKLALDVQLRGHNCRGVKTQATTRKPQFPGHNHTLRVHDLLQVVLPGICLWNAATCTRQSCLHQRTGNLRASASLSTHGCVYLSAPAGSWASCCTFLWLLADPGPPAHCGSHTPRLHSNSGSMVVELDVT